ncbi:MAG: hypothetical protein U1A07_14200, partial [Phenylobacterium sp.]|nr:hypothetical protein [Phenylobacterium sp.]
AARFGSGLKDRVSRIDTAVDTVSKAVSRAPGQIQQDWKIEVGLLRETLDDPAAIRAVERLLVDLTDPDELPAGPARLDWLVSAPAANLKAIRDLLVNRGDAVLTSLVAVARDHVTKARGGVDLSPLHATGALLSEAALSADRLLEGPGS